VKIIGAEIESPVRHKGSHGDLWTTTWADDGELYTASDDTQGFDQACSSNLAISRLSGSDPWSLQGSTVNPMSAFGYWGEVAEDLAFWKANGLASVDGALYLTVSRHSGYIDSGVPYQEAFDSSIVRSTDHGATWTDAPKLGSAMFPGPSFATPFLLDFGRDSLESVDEYIYAISSDGAWNNGNSMRLGRVRREHIARLDPGDWEFIQGVDSEGNFEPIWGRRHDTARSIFRAPGRASMTGIHYISPLRVYVMPQWHYTRLGEPGRSWSSTRWELYQAPAPWGPWSLFHVEDWSPGGFYNPCIISKFTSEDGTKLMIFAAGDFSDCMKLDGYYGLYLFPVELTIDSVESLDSGTSDALRHERELMAQFKTHAENA
jgi:hypothetical protein